MAEKTNGLSPPQGGGFHRLPQIPTMSRNVKIAQSKTSAKCETVNADTFDEAAVIHIEGTDKVVKISSDGLTETTDPPSTVPRQEITEKGQNHEVEKSVKKPRKRQRLAKLEPANSVNSEEKGEHISNSNMDLIRRRGRGALKSNTDMKSEKKMLERSVSETKSENVKSSTRTAVRPELELKVKKKIPESTQTEKKLPLKSSKEPLSVAELDSIKSEDGTVSGIKNNGDNSKPVPVNSDEKIPQQKTTISTIRSLLESTPAHHVSEAKEKKVAKTSQEAPIVEEKSEETDLEQVELKVEKKALDMRELQQLATMPKMYFSAAGRSLPRTVLLRESERPSDDQLARIMEGKTTQFDVSHPVKWHIGDLLWGHVSGHPWWPGMISSDPFSGLFTTIKGGARISRLYHVQYFGDEAERGWVRESSSMTFEGKQKLVDLGSTLIRTTKEKGKKNKLQQAFCPNQRRKAAWDLAVAEAEDALTLNKDDRIDKYTFVYEFLPNKRPAKPDLPEKGTVTSPTSGVQEKKGLKRKEPSLNSDEGSGEGQEISSPKRGRYNFSPMTGQRSRGREEGSFETYCIKHREFVREQHPEYSGSMVIETLKQQWALMTPQQRLRYKSKFSSTAAVEDMQLDSSSGYSKRSARKSRPSLKKLEADGDKESEESRRRRRTLDDAECTTSLHTHTRGRKRKSAVVTEEQTPAKASFSVRSKSYSDSDSSSDFQDDFRPRGRPARSEENYLLEIFKLNNTAPAKKENLCAVCDETTGELVECHGVCQNYFHLVCVGLDSPVEQFKCQECVSGEHTCFFCKAADKETRRCAVSQCGKFYHEECVKKMINARTEGKGFTCPHHVCATCAADAARNPKSVKGRLYRCVRCPTAYHVGDFCIAAGSLHLGGYHILCSNHFQPQKGHKHHQRINVSWCFSCSKGGSLVCCETCPAAFHIECANLNSMPEDAWYCSDCSGGKKPLYGDIIWIKIGNYRWWPAEICHPRSVPTNIQEMQHSVGEFPARFFGSHDYYWTHQGRVFLFQEGDRGSKDTSASRGLFKMYYKGVKEATDAFKLWKAAKENKEQLEQEKNDRKPAPFKFIKANVPIGNVQQFKPDLSEVQRCECKPDQENPCGSDTECINRMLMYECSPNVCPAKDACSNQRFQKRQYPNVVPYRTESRGWGLKTLDDIKKGQFVNEYVGDLIDEEECKRRITQAHEDNVTNFYMLTVDKNRIIDAGPKGNNSRFMNHSCEPNLETQKWTVNGDVRVGLFAIKDIPAGSELTFNYNLECLGNEKTKCSCGSENCSGFLGVRPKPQAAVSVEKKKREKEGKKKRKRKHQEGKKEHDDECFRCREGGELVMCDKPNCPKVYHLQCLNLAKPPHGKWLCPWHHCDVCGKLAVKLCCECPNSFCQQHCEGVITLIKDTLICAEHTDLIEGLAASTSESTSIQSSPSSVDSDDSAEATPPPVKEEKQNPTLEVKIEPGPVSSTESDGVGKNPETKVENDSNVPAVAAGSQVKGEPPMVEASFIKKEKEAIVEDRQKGSMGLTSTHTTDNTSFQLKMNAAEDSHKRRRLKNPGEKKANICRTKARYKAQLKAGSASSSPLPGGTSPSLVQVNTDSDNDSNGLVIDLPPN